MPDDGRGVAIGFSRDFLHAAEQKFLEGGLWLGPVVYGRGEQEGIVERILDAAEEHHPPRAGSSLPPEMIEGLPALVAQVKIWREAARCKNPFFAEEKELRLIYDASMDRGGGLGQRKYRTRGGKLIPYHTLPLSPLPQAGPPIYEVVLGPKCNREFNEPVIKKLLSDNDFDITYLNVWSSEGTYT